VESKQQALGWAAVLGGLAGIGMLLGNQNGVRLAVAITAAFLLIVFAPRSPRFVLTALVVWFITLGLARRLISGLSPNQEGGDPLLLVGAATWTLLAVLALRRGASANRERLTTAVLVLMVLLAASAVNPLQGGLTVGLSGALLVVVPMTAFFVGRTLLDDDLFRRLLFLAAALGLVAAAYGLYQTFLGFPPWDERWIAEHGYAALSVGGVIRAFASFSAASEYASFLGIAIVVWVVHARGVARAWIALPALALLGTALWYESSRESLVLTVVAVGAVLAARAGLTVGRALFLGAAALVAFPIVIAQLAPAQFSNASADRLVQHQVEGLTNPFGEGSSLPLHINLVIGGLANAIHDPLGVGIGAVTIGGEKFGGAFRQTEADPSNVAVAAGLPGLLAYLAVAVLAFPRLYREAARRRDPLSLAALGIVVVTSLQWLNGGHYATAFWPWLILGWSDARRDLDGGRSRLSADGRPRTHPPPGTGKL